MEYEIIKIKIVEMIDSFRSEFKKLSSDEQKHEQMIDSLKSPCQIHILSAPSNKFHILIKTHFTQLQDKFVKIIHFSSDKLITELESFINDPIWKQEAEQNSTNDEIITKSLREELKSILIYFGRMIRDASDLAISASFEGISSKGLQGNFSVWYLYGDLNKIEFINQAKRSVQSYKSSFSLAEKEKSKPAQITESIPNTKLGLGTYCYPPLLIGNYNPSMGDQIMNRQYKQFTENMLVDSFADTPIIITKGGLVCLETKDREKTEKILNAIMGAALLLGLPTHAIKSSEIAHLTIDKNTNQVESSSWSETSFRTMMFSLGMRPLGLYQLSARMKITTNDLDIILKTAKKIWENIEQVNSLRLLLGSFTHLDNDEFSQSFIMSWTLIERYLHNLWNEKIKSADVTNRIVNDLDRWDTYRVLEVLHIDKEISKDDYYVMKILQNLRNDIIHDGYEVTQKQTEDCYQLALQIILKLVGISDKIKYTKDYTN